MGNGHPNRSPRPHTVSESKGRKRLLMQVFNTLRCRGESRFKLLLVQCSLLCFSHPAASCIPEYIQLFSACMVYKEIRNTWHHVQQIVYSNGVAQRHRIICECRQNLLKALNRESHHAKDRLWTKSSCLLMHCSHGSSDQTVTIITLFSYR